MNICAVVPAYNEEKTIGEVEDALNNLEEKLSHIMCATRQSVGKSDVPKPGAGSLITDSLNRCAKKCKEHVKTIGELSNLIDVY